MVVLVVPSHSRLPFLFLFLFFAFFCSRFQPTHRTKHTHTLFAVQVTADQVATMCGLHNRSPADVMVAFDAASDADGGVTFTVFLDVFAKNFLPHQSSIEYIRSLPNAHTPMHTHVSVTSPPPLACCALLCSAVPASGLHVLAFSCSASSTCTTLTKTASWMSWSSPPVCRSFAAAPTTRSWRLLPCMI